MNRDLMGSLLNKVIKIDRGGPESRVGLLIAAESDYIALLTKDDGVVYYNLHHIKSVTENVKKGLEFDLFVADDFDFYHEKDLQSVLQKLMYRWVKINRGGPEKLEGILDAVHEDYITVVSNEEVIRVSTFHLRNISYGGKMMKQKEEKDTNEEKDKNKNNKGSREIQLISSNKNK